MVTCSAADCKSRDFGYAVLWVLIIGGLTMMIVPRFLDRIYYSGDANAHFDGSHFYNPDGDDTSAPPSGGSRSSFIWRMATGTGQRGAWPATIAVTPGHPHPDLTACPALTGGAQPKNWGRCSREPIADDAMAATWIGHATVLVQTPGFAMLTDPVWAVRAGPFGIGPQRVTAPGIAIDNLPKIDLIVVSHNHYDHMDLATLKKLWDRDRPVIVTSHGNEAIMAAHGIEAVALDWGDNHVVVPATVHVARNHHWSGRWGVDRNRALWSSFVIDTAAGRVYFAGDTGFGDGEWTRAAAAIPRTDGSVPPVRLALLPIGAFRFRPGQMATGSHIGPPQAVTLWNRMGRPQTMAIHWGTFRLSDEARDTPPQMLRLMMRCVGADPARFSDWPVGQARLVAPASIGAIIDDQRVAQCAQSPATTRLE